MTDILLVGDLKKALINVPDDYCVDTSRTERGFHTRYPALEFATEVEVIDEKAKIVIRCVPEI